MKFNKGTKKRKELLKWIRALRSGKYSQTRHKLQDKDGYCCLGVGCKVLIPKNKQKIGKSNFLVGAMPSCQDYSTWWLREISFDIIIKLGTSLTEMNDAEKATFDEIADILELLYIHNALED